ncbi:MAG: hypothetical protein Q8L13_06280 [Bradyrhizobium sp.]|uniref:hypothetical protein n=1 Tax=Bradyrhizobium sp. TaxID=376 RepID=UPI00273054C5|nr:hypothetical protein [Bradyrhizobium sp.]MDP1865937.1 hypothetical protein [Bradyrhizobium sp.]
MARKNAAGRLMAAGLLSVMLGSMGAASQLFAQAGSIGGTIGKTDKSQSGADEAPSIRPEPGTRKPARKADTPRNVASSSCSKMPGNWAWFTGVTAVIRANGTATAGPYSATWTCANDSVVMHWNHGYTDRLRLSRDGTHLEGTNGFITVTGDRR